MKIARIEWEGRARFARVELAENGAGVAQYHLLAAETLVEAVSAAETGEVAPGAARLLSPVTPTKVMAMACAFWTESRPFDPATDRAPFLFIKPESAIIGPGAAIEVPEPARGALFESELAVVIGKECKAVQVEQALDYVLGYTICNDMTAPALMGVDGQWARGKGLDTFCPVGPWVETELANPDDVQITASLIRAGETLDLVNDSTARQIWTAAQSIAYCSEFVTLRPGDVVSLGCPPGPIAVEDGDEVRITIAGVGTLHNPVRFL